MHAKYVGRICGNKLQQSWEIDPCNSLKISRILTPVMFTQTEISSNTVAHLTSRSNTYNKDVGKKVEIENKSDNRLFIRLHFGHEWRKTSPVGLREVLIECLSVSPGSISLIMLVRSGFVLTPCNIRYREDLLCAAEGRFMSRASLRLASIWIPVLVPTVPKTIMTINCQAEPFKPMLTNKIERESSKRPTLVKLYGTASPKAPHRT